MQHKNHRFLLIINYEKLNALKIKYQGICNPWRFANRREVANLTLFAHRFYNPRLMRWQTTDPLGFKDGLNLYAYTHNNPFYYKDPDGRFILTLPFPVVFTAFQAAFGAAATISGEEALAFWEKTRWNI